MDIIYLILILPFFIYWCINEKIGLQLCIVSLLSIWAILVFRHLNENLPFNFDIKWFIIAVIFCCYLILRNKIEKLLLKGGFRAFMIASAVFSFVMILYRPAFEFVIPGGTLLGLCVGYCLNKRYVGFKSGNVLQRTGFLKYLALLARFLLGIAVLLLIVFRVEIIIEQISKNQNVFLYCFLCYALMGLWVSIAAPWIFIKLHLAGIEEKQ